MNFEEFLKPHAAGEINATAEAATESTAVESIAPESVEEEDTAVDSDEIVQQVAVQQAVVASLAADKAEQDEHISNLRRENYALHSELSSLREKIEELKAELGRTGDILARNSETPLSNMLTLLERNPELQDRFPGETRDHVLESLKEARDAAEKDGRLRRAQILESVLVDNDASGELAKRRNELEKLFNDNQNILSGPVINELDKLNISYKHGENYLLPAEILKRTY